MQTLALEREKTSARLDRLTEGFLDGTIPQELFREQRERLALDKRELEESREQSAARTGESIERSRHYLELAFSAPLSYEAASDDDKRETMELVTSNRRVEGRQPLVELREPFSYVADAKALSSCALPRDVHRTKPRWSVELVEKLLMWVTDSPSVDSE